MSNGFVISVFPKQHASDSAGCPPLAVAAVVTGERAGPPWTTRAPVVWNRSFPCNLDLTDLTVALADDVVHFASDVALEAADGFQL
ncbi:hypothetical protein LMG29542_08514 [Paraburkholderia humisilvae]|uniref:Uncharacterized protein n=1 Tax=Paraburkholderia humisilvae TaxID=627669 RepID=A0A6J5FBM6_9BURK|nr:hypothetical protein LMG29542_08514 [Paraburkholderia humisilvae]